MNRSCKQFMEVVVMLISDLMNQPNITSPDGIPGGSPSDSGPRLNAGLELPSSESLDGFELGSGGEYSDGGGFPGIGRLMTSARSRRLQALGAAFVSSVAEIREFLEVMRIY